MKIKILNRMACGKPVFAIPLDLETCSVFKDMENIVVFDNSDSFREKISLLIENPKIYFEIAYNSLQTVKQYFNWESYL